MPGQVYAVSVTMQNTGNTTWSEANAYRLYSENPAFNLTWGVNRVYLPGTVVPGASVTFNFNVTAPSTPGVYNFQWKMIRENYTAFGALNWTARWYRAGGRKSLDEIAEEAARFLLRR